VGRGWIVAISAVHFETNQDAVSAAFYESSATARAARHVIDARLANFEDSPSGRRRVHTTLEIYISKKERGKNLIGVCLLSLNPVRSFIVMPEIFSHGPNQGIRGSESVGGDSTWMW
jgi:hypothetical protein